MDFSLAFDSTKSVTNYSIIIIVHESRYGESNSKFHLKSMYYKLSGTIYQRLEQKSERSSQGVNIGAVLLILAFEYLKERKNTFISIIEK